MKISVIGASGFVGGELLRLLVTHPKVTVNMVTSRQQAGEYVHRVHPSLKGFIDLKFSAMDIDKIADSCDLVFVSVPHGSANKIVKDLYERDIKIIDLSADRSEEHTSELQSPCNLVCRLLLEKKNKSR